MKTALLLIAILFVSQYSSIAQSQFELDPTQSMIMTGKGKGQDATINPYKGQDCYAIVSNIGFQDFSVRIQKKGVIIQEIPLKKGETKKIVLLKDQELYIDPNEVGISKLNINYEAIE